MSVHSAAHVPVGGPLLTRPMRWLLLVAGLGLLAAIWRFVFGIGAVSNLNQGYPWGIWIAFDVVVGTALGCGGYAVAILVYILNKGRYHPLVRPALLTSLLGYGLAVIAVAIDLGRPWELWKVPIFFWRWSHSPQLEVALCVALYNLVLLVELSPALFEKWKSAPDTALRRLGEKGLRIVDKGLVWFIALGLLLPTMHQSSLGTMMLLPATKLHALWFTPWLPFLFLVNCVVMGYGIVVCEAAFSARAFRRPAETPMLARLSGVALWVALFWVAFRLLEVALAGELALLGSRLGLVFLAELGVHLAAVAVLLSPARRADPVWQVRAAILLILAGVGFRLNTYLVAFDPGRHFRYFPAVPELLITFGIVAAEIAIYVWAVKTFPILSGRPAAPIAR
ncbi:MAG: Ni/Fe-hydrogenase cytochrome b subunit [Thermoanaerobaculia bacterium]|nr:Ni/Fe-hydrogenase cytochrome b subunit [Thermoanaerobaculia bacterium]MCZ7652885.1 Ni/Fe-hydrogenase cytochrome b subunit [Thermoanaerobaculia bacterium]